MDVFSKEMRSKVMSRIRGKDTKIEMMVRKYLHALGFRFRVNDSRYIGKPDIVLPKYNTIIFVNGCFWHSHGCKYSTIPKTNTEFWIKKLNRTKVRDEEAVKQLSEKGWNVIVVWECQIKHSFEETMETVVKNILNDC